MSLCRNCKHREGRTCKADGQGARLLETGAKVRLCAQYRDGDGRRQLVDKGGRLG